MEITLIKKGYYTSKIIIGKPTENLKSLVTELNNNPLNDEEYSIEEKYSPKTVSQLESFLFDNL